jgi:hypothetical protein
MFKNWKPVPPPEPIKLQPVSTEGKPAELQPTGRMKALAHEESRIERGLSHFREVGEALKTIRDKQLFANNHQTRYLSWVDYLSKRWNMSDTHATRLMIAAEVVQELAQRGHSVLPSTESQARPLAALPTDQAVAAWSEVVSTTPPEAITAAAVEEKVLKYRKPRRNRMRKPAAVKIKGKGWKITIERSLASTDVIAVLMEAIDRLEKSKTADKTKEAA